MFFHLFDDSLLLFPLTPMVVRAPGSRMQCNQSTFYNSLYVFLAAIAALYVTMSVGWSDGRSVGVNEFQSKFKYMHRIQ